MKYLKKYKLYESDIKRSFTDWLNNPNSKNKEFIYEFKFPCKKMFNIDKGNKIEDIAQYLLNEKNINIYEIISKEMETDLPIGDFDVYNIDTDFDDIEISEEEIKANFNEYFNSWLDKNYNGKLDKFYRMYDLDFEEYIISNDDFESIQFDFNKSNLLDKYPFKEYNQNFQFISIEIKQLKDDNIIIGEFEVNRQLTNDEIDSINDFISNQLSDEWGDSFQEEEEEEIGGIMFLTSIKTWWIDSYPEWYLEINIKV